MWKATDCKIAKTIFKIFKLKKSSPEDIFIDFGKRGRERKTSV